jgi:RHS repeat-associated protein
MNGFGKLENMKQLLLTLCMGLCLVLAMGMPTVSYAHTDYPPPPDEPNPKEPPPPPPCQSFKTEMVKVGEDDCTGEPIMEPRRVCADGGTGGNVSYRSGYESFTRKDLVVNGAYTISMTRQYMSNSRYDSPVGYGWSFNHDVRLFEYPDGNVIVRTGCGVNYKFVLTGGTYQAEVGTDVLTKNVADGSFDLTYLDGKRDHFDDQGRLIEAWDTLGNRLEYTYSTEKQPLIGSSPRGIDPARPITVAYVFQLTKIEEKPADGSSGNSVTLSYNPTTGRLASITSNDGRTVSYVHDDAGGGLTKGNLIQVNALEGVVSTYKYEDIDASTLEYKDHHNMTEIKHSADSTPIQLIYDALPNDRVITETVGNQVYSFDWSQSPLRTIITESITDDQGLNPVYAIREYAFDDIGYLNEFIDALGNKTIYQNDSYGNIKKEEIFENQGTLATPNLILVRTVDSTYSTAGKKLTQSVVLDSGETITYQWTYDGPRTATKETWSSADPAKIFKIEKLFNYNASGLPTTVQAERRYKDDGTFLETTYTYNSNGDLLTITLPDGHVITNEYGAAYGGKYVTKTYHSIAGILVPDLQETYQYDANGNRTNVTDALNHTTIITYDEKNRRTSVTNHLGHLTTYVYDANDNLTEIRRDRSAVADQIDSTRFTYDGKNQLTLIESTDAVGAYYTRTSLRFDSKGNVIARGDAYGNETLLTYDLENRLTRITDAEGNYISYTLNALGRTIKVEYFKVGDILMRTSSALFDELNRLVQLMNAAGQTMTFTYDAMSNHTTKTDALGRLSVYSYNNLGRLTSIQNAAGKDTVYQYDTRGRLTLVTDPRGMNSQYQFNELGQLIDLTSLDTGVTEYTYDLSGKRITQKNARNITVTYDYDEINRMTSETYPTASLNVTYGYDVGANGIGKLTSMTDAEGSSTYEYDTHGNRIKETRATNGQNYITRYAFDLNNRLTQITYPSGRTVDYTRNTLGQVTNVTMTPSGGSTQTINSNMSYLPFGALDDMSYGNGLNLDQTFDSDYRLTDQVLGSLYNRTYGYDVVNNITAITDNINSSKNQSFNYDVLDRLDDATGVYGVFDYTYDDVGNRLTKTVDANPMSTYSYGAISNQLDSITGAETHSFIYDANGNTTTKDAFSFTYDDTNRLTQVTDSINTTSYAFNGKGERVKKADPTTTLYHYDNAGNLLFESDTAGNTQVEYVLLGNQRIAMINSSGLYYTHTDHLGTVQLLTDSTGTTVWQADYNPFGEANIITSTITNNLRFPGQYYDSETGFHYNYFRDFDPGIGRYIQSDPIGLLGGINTYSYSVNSPLVYFDLYGLWPDCKYFPKDPLIQTSKKRFRTNQFTLYGFNFGFSNSPTVTPSLPSIGGGKKGRYTGGVPAGIGVTEVYWAKTDFWDLETYETTTITERYLEICTDTIIDECGNEKEISWSATVSKKPSSKTVLISSEPKSRTTNLYLIF